VTAFLPTLAWAHLSSGSLETASRLAGDAKRRATAESNQRTVAVAEWMQGRVALAMEDQSGAKGHLERALDGARKTSYPHLEARVLSDLAGLSLQAGDAAQAMEFRATAQTIFRRLGAIFDASSTSTLGSV